MEWFQAPGNHVWFHSGHLLWVVLPSAASTGTEPLHYTPSLFTCLSLSILPLHPLYPSITLTHSFAILNSYSQSLSFFYVCSFSNTISDHREMYKLFIEAGSCGNVILRKPHSSLADIYVTQMSTSLCKWMCSNLICVLWKPPPIAWWSSLCC